MTEDTQRDKRLRTVARYCTVFLGIFAVMAALKLMAHVMIPLMLAVFLILIIWPFKVWLDERLPKSLSYMGSVLGISIMLIAIIAIVWLSAMEIAQQQAAYRDAFDQFVTHAKQELSRKGVSTRATLTLEEVRVLAMTFAEHFKEWLIIFCLMFSYILLAIPEVSSWKTKLLRCVTPEHGNQVVKTSTEIAISYQNYMAFVVTSGVFNGCLTYLLALVLHLDFPITWGVVIFLLNFVPTLGPSLIPFLMAGMALVQFDAGSTMPYIVFFASGAVQLFVTHVIEPRLPQEQSELSAIVVLFSLTFWGFIWGISGMLLSTPLTMAIVITFKHFKDTQWIACMLTDVPPSKAISKQKQQ